MAAEIPADAAIKFIEKLKIPEGPKAGSRLVLAEYQKAFIRGALDPANMVAVWSVGRGASKTATSAAIALAAIMGVWNDTPKRDVPLAARNRDQAKTAFGFITGFVEGLPKREREKFIIRRGSRLEVEYTGNGGGIARCIAADGRSILGGAPCPIMILDERSAWDKEKGDALENALLSGGGKRGCTALIISTAAADDTNTFSRWCDAPPPGTYVQEHRPAPGLPADDLPSLLIANPGASEGIGASPEWLLAQARRAIARGGSALSSFRNLNRNERVSTDTRSVLITTDQWLRCEVEELPERAGPLIVGLDLGGSSSMSAWTNFWPQTQRLECYGAFPGSPSLADRGANDAVGNRYELMRDRAELLTFGANVVPIHEFMSAMLAKLDGHPIAALCCDRFRQSELIEAMSKTPLRIAPTWRGQGWKDSGEDTERFRQFVFDQRVRAKPSLLLRSAFADAVVLVDPAGSAKIAKARSLGRIDAAAASVLAIAEGSRLLGRGEKRAARWVWA